LSILARPLLIKKLPLLIAALLALSSLPAASASALPDAHIEIEGDGAGEIVGASGPTGGNPRIECVWDGASQEQTGVCDAEAGEAGGFVGVAVEHREQAGSEFGGWTIEEGFEIGGSCSAFYRQCGVLTSGTPIRIKAVFTTGEVVKFHLTARKTGTGRGFVASAPPGINCIPGCGAEGADFLQGQRVVVTATRDADSTFEGWSRCDAEPSPGQCEVTMNETREVEAEFRAIPLVPLTVRKLGHPEGGTVVSNPAGIDCGPACDAETAEFREGEVVALHATAEEGYAFVGWRGCGHAGRGECEVVVGGAATEVKAVFARRCGHRRSHPWLGVCRRE
jgi:Divergent InlB B-repeat domain